MSVFVRCALSIALAIVVSGCTSTGDDLYTKLPDAAPIDAIVIADADTTDASSADAAGSSDAVSADAAPAIDALPAAD